MPSLIGHKFSLDDAYVMFFVRDKLVIFLLLCLICCDHPWKNWTGSLTNWLLVLMLVVSALFLGNFLVTTVEVGNVFNYVNEWNNG